jgi:hypothetical protein
MPTDAARFTARRRGRPSSNATTRCSKRPIWFGSMRPPALADPVAMEATGAYYLLEDDFKLLPQRSAHRARARPQDRGPGRPVDRLTARASAAAASFVPPREIRELRDLDPLPQPAHPRAPARGEPPAQATRGRQHQGRLGHHQPPRRLGKGQAWSVALGRVRSRGLGGTSYLPRK